MTHEKIWKSALIPLIVLSAAVLLWASGITQQAYTTITNNGTALAQEPTLNFVNSGCVDNAAQHRTDCTFGALFAQTNSAFSNSTAETSIVGTGAGSKILPANFYGVGTTLRFHASGFYSTTSSPGTLTVKIKHSGGVTGTVILGSTGAISPLVSVTNGAWRLWGDITCRTTGTGGSVMVNSLFEGIASSLSTLTPADASVVNSGSAITVDTTAAQTVDLTVQWSASGQVITMSNFVLYSN